MQAPHGQGQGAERDQEGQGGEDQVGRAPAPGRQEQLHEARQGEAGERIHQNPGGHPRAGEIVFQVNPLAEEPAFPGGEGLAGYGRGQFGAPGQEHRDVGPDQQGGQGNVVNHGFSPEGGHI